MPAINFPPNPSVNATHTHNGKNWKWNGVHWSANTDSEGSIQSSWHTLGSTNYDSSTSPQYDYKYYRITDWITYDLNRVYEIIIDADDNYGMVAIYHLYISQHANTGNHDRIIMSHVSGRPTMMRVVLDSNEHVWIAATNKWGAIKIRGLHENEDVTSMPFADSQLASIPSPQFNETAQFIWDGDTNTLALMPTTNLNGDFGIGTTSPSSILAGTKGLAIYDSSSPGLSLANTENSWIFYNQGTDLEIYNTSAGEDKFILTAGGDFHILTGKVGIGTSNPDAHLHTYSPSNTTINTIKASNHLGVSAALIAYQNSHAEVRVGTNHPLLFKTNDNNERMRISGSTANVGIGGVDPLARLHIKNDQASTAQATLKLESPDPMVMFEDSTNTGNCYMRWQSGTGTAQGFRFWHDGNDVDGSGTNSGNPDFMIDLDGDVGIGINSPDAPLHVDSGSGNLVAKFSSLDEFAYISFEDNGTSTPPLVGVQDDDLIILTSNSTRMRIDADGNVGINTTSPKTKLHISHGETSVFGPQEVLRLQGDWNGATNVDGDGALIRFTNQHDNATNPNTGEYNVAGIAGLDDSSNWGGSLHFQTSPTGGTGGNDLQTRMVVRYDGNVGIGTVDPSYALDVRSDTGINVRSLVNSSDGAQIRFSDHSSQSQYGWIRYKHSDGAIATGELGTSNDGFLIGGSEDNTIVRIQGGLKVDGEISENGSKLTDKIASWMDRGYVLHHQAPLNLAVGWYTIATNTGDRASARFGIWDIASGKHQSVTFYASSKYGQNGASSITVLHNTHYSGSPFRHIRIKDAATYDGAVLQVYVDVSENDMRAAILGDNFQVSGWDLVDWIPDATDPQNGVANYSNMVETAKVDLDLIQQGGLATTGEIYAGGNGVSGSYLNKVFHEGNFDPTDYLPLSGGTITGDVDLTARLAIKKTDNDISDHIMFYNGDVRVGEIGCHDNDWLRINSSTAKNIYTPRMFRADGGFQVDNKWIASADGNTLYENNVALSSKYVQLTTKATTSTLGLVKLGTGTIQTTNPNTPTTTASRTYAVQMLSNDQLVVNVPWTDSGSSTPSVSTIYFNNETTTSGVPSTDGAVFRYEDNFFGSSLDALVIEKTDSNQTYPDGGIAFTRRGSGGSSVETLVLRGDSTGSKVGIGTRYPSAVLHIKADNDHLLKLQSSDRATNGPLYMTFCDSNDLQKAWFGFGSSLNEDISIWNNESGAVKFATADNERMKITADGDAIFNYNVGIGTTTPQTSLHVEGSLIVNVYENSTQGGGIYFRDHGQGNYTTSYPYNMSILAYDHSSNGNSADGLSINAYDGISFCTGSNTRQQRMLIDSAGAVRVNTELYNDGWFRNTGAGEGLYHETNGNYFYSRDSKFWHITSKSDQTQGGLGFFKGHNDGTHVTNRKGFVFWDGTGFGLLDNDGSWAFRTVNNEAQLFYDGSEKLNTTSTGVNITGDLEISKNLKLSGVTESFGTYSSSISSSTTITADASSKKLWRITSGSITGSWTINVTNINLAVGDATNLSFVVESGTGTSHIPSTFKISGTSQTIKWQGGSAPTGTGGTAPVDIYSFTVFCTGTNTYTVLGSHVSFDS